MAEAATIIDNGREFERRLKNWPIAPSQVTYRRQDVALYALSIGVGDDLENRHTLRYLLQESITPLPTFTTVFVAYSPWLFDRANGVDTEAILLKEMAINLVAPISPAGTVISLDRVAAVWDRGAGRGALIQVISDLSDKDSGRKLASIDRIILARNNGGFSGTKSVAPISNPLPSRAPDSTHLYTTRRDSALLFRLHGDLHPIHWDSDFANRQGFGRPILHGMCSMGVAGYAIIKGHCDYDTSKLTSFRVNFKSPVYPGESLRTECWVKDGTVLFRTSVVEDERTVISGSAAIIV